MTKYTSSGALIVADETSNGGTVGSKFTRLQNADDLAQTFTYLEPGTPDERISTIVYSSIALGAGSSVTETYIYAGVAGSYRISTITRS